MLYPDLLKILALLTSLPVAYIFTKIVIILSKKTNFVSNPNPIVESHKSAIPYGGGISIGITIIVFLLVNINEYQFSSKIILSILPIIVIGLLDDVFQFTPLIKLVLEITSVLPFLVFYLNISVPYYFFLVIILFIVLSQNAWNLIDVMDGLAAGVSVIVFLSLALILSFHQEIEFYPFLSFLIACSVLGFRFLNKHKAKIFLGETGSLLLGSLFAFIVVLIFFINEMLSYFLILLGIVPFFELLFLIIIRTKKGIPFYVGSPDHFALRMLNNGFNVNAINNRVLLFCSVHSLIIILFCFWGITTVNFIICLGISIVSLLIAYKYFQSLPARSIIK